MRTFRGVPRRPGESFRQEIRAPRIGRPPGPPSGYTAGIAVGFWTLTGATGTTWFNYYFYLRGFPPPPGADGTGLIVPSVIWDHAYTWTTAPLSTTGVTNEDLLVLSIESSDAAPAAGSVAVYATVGPDRYGPFVRAVPS